MDWGLISLFGSVAFTIGLSYFLAYIFPDDDEKERRRLKKREKELEKRIEHLKKITNQ